MTVTAIVAGWLIGSLPLAVFVGRMISGAERISITVQRPRVSARYRAA